MEPNTKRARLVARAYAASLAFWLALSPLVGWQTYYLERIEHLKVNLSTDLLVYAARYFTVAILTPPIFYWVNRWPVSRAQVRRIGVYALAYFPFICAFALIRWLILPPWMEDTLSWGARTVWTLFALGYSTFADIFLLYLSVITAAHAYTYFVRGQQQEMDRLRLRQSLAQSELQALRAQLHPHFLFNTLQGVSTLIEVAPATAQQMLFTLATLLRVVLKHGSVDLISVKEELSFLRAYLELEQMRLGPRLTVRWNIAPEAEQALIPQLLLQPLVENAIVHGIANARDGGWIEISVAVRNKCLEVEIRNSVGGTSQPGLGVGLANVKARLQHLYAEDELASFDFRVEGAQAVARLVVPAASTVLLESRAELERS
jgi:two-component system LytT family sensor kinase